MSTSVLLVLTWFARLALRKGMNTMNDTSKPVTSRGGSCTARTLGRFLALALLPCLAGCVAIERKELVVAVPPNSDTIELYYVFEGISVLDGTNLESAASHLDDLQKPDFSFFAPGAGADNPLLKGVRFEKLRFYLNPDRKRTLCADRRVTVMDRHAFAKTLNEMINSVLATGQAKSAEEWRKELAQGKESLNDPQLREVLTATGMAPLLQAAVGLVEIAEGLDDDSFDRFNAAVKQGFRWVRFEESGIRLVVPATRDCAKKIACDEKTAKWVREMQPFVRPLTVEVVDEGLAIVLGRKGEPVRFTHTDPRPYEKEHEAGLIRSVGSPGAVLVGGKPVDAQWLIERFIAENVGKR
jgi:hypothetical protein